MKSPEPRAIDGPPSMLWRRWLAIVEATASTPDLPLDDGEYRLIHDQLSESCRRLARSGASGPRFRDLGAMIGPYPTTRSLALAEARAVAELKDRVYRAIDEFEGRSPRRRPRSGRLVAIVLLAASSGLLLADRVFWRGAYLDSAGTWWRRAVRSVSTGDGQPQLLALAAAVVAIGLLALSGPPRR